MSQIKDNEDIMVNPVTHKDIEFLSEQLSEILKAVGSCRTEIQELKIEQARIGVERTHEKSAVARLQAEVNALQLEIVSVKSEHDKLVTQINTLRWAGSVAFGLLGFLLTAGKNLIK